MPVRCLSFHADYRCRHSGACCTSGWSIPVEPAQRARLDAAIASGALRLDDLGGPPRGEVFDADRLPDGSSILRVSHAGREVGVSRADPEVGPAPGRTADACSCYDSTARRCRIHAQLGHDALPVSCQHFPRVCLIDRDTTSVTLSHYCPTAAGLLLAPAGLEPGAARDPAAIAVVDAPPGFAPMALEGLDARDALPPLLRPRMLADRESYRSWESAVLEVLNEAPSAESALATIIDATEGVRDWEPRDGALGDAVLCAFEAAREPKAPSPCPPLSAGALSLDALVRQCVPEGLAAADVPASPMEVDAELVAPRWPSFSAPVRRYLAAKAFASWIAYQGRGLRTIACSLVAASSVLRVEAVRQCLAAGRTLDEALLVEALRSADLLLVHLASREELARRLSAVEETDPGEMREAVTGDGLRA